MTPDAQAQEFSRAAFASFPPHVIQGAATLIAELIRQAENEVLEEAAIEVARMRSFDDVLQVSFGAPTAGQRTAALVRSLKHRGPPLDVTG